MAGAIRFTSYPKTQAPPEFVPNLVALFASAEKRIGTKEKPTGLSSDKVLGILAPGLVKLGFLVETKKTASKRIDRPVFFGENGAPTVRYQIDAYHPHWRCGLEVEAGRAWMGNAVYRDIVQAMVMVGVDHLCLAVANRYRFKSNQRESHSDDYDRTTAIVDALYAHSRIQMPYGLTVIGY